MKFQWRKTQSDEESKLDHQYLHCRDYTVKVSNLPPPEKTMHSNLQELKIFLAAHLKEVIINENQVFQELEDSEVKPYEIVSIQFAHSQF